MVKSIVANAVGNTARKQGHESNTKIYIFWNALKISATGINIAPPINNPVAANESALIVGHRRVMMLPIA